MKNKNGFTLIELLAVIIVLGIVLSISIPAISNVIKGATKKAFENNAKMVIKAIEYKKIENELFDPLELTKENMQELIGISGDNYTQVNFSFEDNKIRILLVGNGPWAGLVVYGTITSMNVVNIEDCNIIPPLITIIGDNPAEIGQGETYVDAGATATDLEDGDVPLTSTIIKNANGVVVDYIDTTSFVTYTITYTATDKDGNTAFSIRKVNVVDRIPPVITLLGNSTVSINLGDVYTDAGATAVDNIDGDITSKIVVTGKVFPGLVGSYDVIYDVKDSFGNAATSVKRTVNVTSSASTFNYIGGAQTFTAPQTSTYKIELWGAQGGSSGGKGGYVSGEINLNKNDVLNIYVGGTTTTSAGGYNGGGQGTSAQGSYGFGGGGGTDVRMGGTTNKDRIMVAGAGGGNSLWNTYFGGAGGGLTGLSGTGIASTNYYGSGGTQTAGGAPGTGDTAGSPGTFFAGGNSVYAGGAGGGGYYGGGGAGYSGNSGPAGGGGGGSSFISGHAGCNAINSSGTPTGQPNHFSGYTFKNGQIIAGNASMPTTTTGTETGHSGNGYAKITRIGAANRRPTISINGDNPVNLYQGVAYIDAGATATDDEDGNITNKITSTSTVNTSLPGTYEVTYSVRDSDGITVTAKRTVKIYAALSNFAYTGGSQTFKPVMNGTYKIELWGAQGGSSGGKGGYVSGEINLNQNDTLYIYVGGTTTTSAAGYNGGGQGTSAQGSYGFGGGGGTDVRIGGTANKDRIMVAGAGGGDSLWNTYLGGAGGGLTGLSGTGIASTNYYGYGGTQTAGGAPGTGDTAGSPGTFFTGGNSVFAGGAGGGGYYGGGGAGYSGNAGPAGGGGGGSSFISGYVGCNAINSSGTPTGQPNHFSGYTFKNGQVIAGNASMPTTTTGTETGHSGNGYAKITYIVQ